MTGLRMLRIWGIAASNSHTRAERQTITDYLHKGQDVYLDSSTITTGGCSFVVLYLA